MLNWHDPSSGTESLALHVTVVVPTANLSPDITALPAPVSHTMVVMTPSTVSLAVGNGDHITLASAIAASTYFIGTLFGQYTIGTSMSALI